MSGHHNVHDLHEDVEEHLALLFNEREQGHPAVEHFRDNMIGAFRSFCPNVLFVSEDQIDLLAKALYTKVMTERKKTAPDLDAKPWDRAEGPLKNSWRDAIKIVLHTGELPPETQVFACRR